MGAFITIEIGIKSAKAELFMYRPFFRAKGFATTTSDLGQRDQALLKAFSGFGFESEILEARAVRLFVSSPQRPTYWLEVCRHTVQRPRACICKPCGLRR